VYGLNSLCIVFSLSVSGSIMKEVVFSLSVSSSVWSKIVCVSYIMWRTSTDESLFVVYPYGYILSNV
jgi:hypothetical protein